MSADPTVLVIGGGIIGLSTAMALAQGTPPARPLVLEKETGLAAHQTGHNSGVIHSGIYYKPDSLKARYTVEGAREMVAFARAKGIAHEICGKVVVATRPDELPRLEELHRRGVANGTPGLEMIGPEQLHEIEPHAAGLKALRVASTGIIDYTAVAQAYADTIRAHGGEIRTGTRVCDIRRDGDAWVVETNAGTERVRHLINCAGLHSDLMARLAGTVPPVRIVPFRGEYFTLAPRAAALVRHLVYPVPDPRFPFLGIHLSRGIDDRVHVGPNAVLAFKREGYRWEDVSVKDTLKMLAYSGFWRMVSKYWTTGVGEVYRSISQEAFVKALQKLIPELRLQDVKRAGSGVRAQAVAPDGSLVDDFRIVETERMVHVLNAPSPAATASIPIGERIAAMAAEALGR